jgi:urease accessory protein UreF
MIRWAHECATRNNAKDLIELDEFLAALPLPQALKNASILIGRRQLATFSGLKGHTFLRRYHQAVESHPAAGQHVTVYGVFLHLFSIPLRNGLAGYAYQTVEGFLDTAARQIPMSELQRREILEATCAPLPAQVERSLAVTREDLLAWFSESSVDARERKPCVPNSDR